MITNRFPAVDYFRGFILFLLAAESTGLYEHLDTLFPHSFVLKQFFHADWQGLHFWDLIQPGFMLIAGSSLYFSTYKRLDQGASYATLWPHIIKRSILLFLAGTGLHCIYRGEMVLELWNVLTQLAFTTLITFFLLRFSIPLQIAASLLLLLIAHSLYMFSSIPGFDQPFTPDQNFGSYVDLLVMGKLSNGHWIAMNFLPTAAHTIWGGLIGRLIHRTNPPKTVLQTLIGLGLLGIIVGYGLDFAGIPIIKRTATLSFIAASGGWVTLMMALFYANWMKGTGQIQLPKYLQALGNNSIFIYVFFETIVTQWLNKTTHIFVGGFANLVSIPEPWGDVLNSIVVLMLIVRIATWLDSKKIYWKL
jgi:predicted acyltransferase